MKSQGKWDTPKHAYHSVRVMCDEAGLDVNQKNTICACIYQESEFYNILPDGTPVRNDNFNRDGSISSTDWGIAQINEYWHIKKFPDFPSVQYVLDHPEEAVAYMIKMFKSNQLSLWSSYKSGAYRKWLAIDSPMWRLRA